MEGGYFIVSRFMGGSVFLKMGTSYPSQLIFDDDGRLDEVFWFKNNLLHRENNLPAMIGFHESGNVSSYSWYENGSNYRDNDLPSFVLFYSNGLVARETWFSDVQRHRVSGPAVIAYNEKGKIQGCVYYLDGVKVEKEEWDGDSRVIDYYRKLKNHNSGVIVSDVSF